MKRDELGLVKRLNMSNAYLLQRWNSKYIFAIPSHEQSADAHNVHQVETQESLHARSLHVPIFLGPIDACLLASIIPATASHRTPEKN